MTLSSRLRQLFSTPEYLAVAGVAAAWLAIVAAPHWPGVAFGCFALAMGALYRGSAPLRAGTLLLLIVNGGAFAVLLLRAFLGSGWT